MYREVLQAVPGSALERTGKCVSKKAFHSLAVQERTGKCAEFKLVGGVYREVLF